MNISLANIKLKNLEHLIFNENTFNHDIRSLAIDLERIRLSEGDLQDIKYTINLFAENYGLSYVTVFDCAIAKQTIMKHEYYILDQLKLSEN